MLGLAKGKNTNAGPVLYNSQAHAATDFSKWNFTMQSQHPALLVQFY